jgi:hypothetical protein
MPAAISDSAASSARASQLLVGCEQREQRAPQI